MTRASTGLAALTASIALGLAAPAAAQEAVQFDVRPTFNADVIVNTDPAPPTQFDETNSPIDLGNAAAANWAFGTQASIEASNCLTPRGLPNDGFFPANADHPDVQLAYRDDDSGNNARRTPPPPPVPPVPPTDTYTFATEPGFYSAVHMFATTGSGTANMTVTLQFAGGAPITFNVPDWFTDPPTGGAYYLIDGRDRQRPGSGPGATPPNQFACENRDDAAIFGFEVPADPTRPLVSVTVVVTPGAPAPSVLNFFGATGVRERRALDHFKCYDAFELRKRDDDEHEDDDDHGDDDHGDDDWSYWDGGMRHSSPRRRVSLTDQFGSHDAFVEDVEDLCNPVNKNGEGIQSEDAHLVAYEIDPIRRKFERRTVEIENQFGTLMLQVKEPDRLLVPSAKAERGEELGQPPEQLDHFQCYPVEKRRGHDDGFEPRTVETEDQFLAEQLEVRRPSALCNPVDKNGEGIGSPDEHLVCYEVKGGRFWPQLVSTRNQFGDSKLVAYDQDELCLPSSKEEVAG